MKFKFHSGEKVLCFEPDPTKARVLYDAKVPPRRDREEARAGDPGTGGGCGCGRRRGAGEVAGPGAPCRRLLGLRGAVRAAGGALGAPLGGVGARTLPLPPGAGLRTRYRKPRACSVARLGPRRRFAHATPARAERRGGRLPAVFTFLLNLSAFCAAHRYLGSRATP